VDASLLADALPVMQRAEHCAEIGVADNTEPRSNRDISASHPFLKQ
jgi:hypothetical protein